MEGTLVFNLLQCLCVLRGMAAFKAVRETGARFWATLAVIIEGLSDAPEICLTKNGSGVWYCQ